MKKYFTIIAALFAIAAVSCQKETALLENNKAEDVIETLTPAGEVTVFSANLPDAPESRSILGVKDGSVYHPLWVANDSIIVNGVLSAEAQLSNGGQSAKFAVAVPDSSAYIAIAPGRQIRNTDFHYSEGSYDMLFPGAGKPQIDTLDEGGNPTFDPRVGFLAGYGTDNNLTFRHLNVYFRITTTAGTDSDNIRYVYIRDADPAGNGYIAGVWTVTYSGSGITFEPKTRSSVVAFDAGEAGLPQGTPMVVALPAYNYPEGLIVTIKDINGHFISFKIKSSATQFSASAGTVYEFNRVFSPESGTINSAEDWEEFASAINTGKDFNVYRWVGNGTVKLGSDINTTTLTKISKEFTYTFDGQDNTITRSAATGALFNKVSGTISNLNLDGALSSSATICASLADYLYAGGRIEGCTTSVDITNNSSNYVRAAGLVAVMNGGTIYGCNNSGDVSASATAGDKTYNFQVAGIVGQVDVTDATHGGDILIENCTNSGAITATPSVASNSVGFNYVGVAGIAGWLRGQNHSFTITNCDNTSTGTITYSAESVSSTNGSKAFQISVGGIIGLAGDLGSYPIFTGSAYNNTAGAFSSIENSGSYYTGTDTGLDVTITDCDNAGLVHNCGDNYSATRSLNNKVYTGGIAGSLVGTSAKSATLTSCSNTGTLLTYDRTGDTSSARPLYCQVVGGLIGYGGYVSIDNCTVNCTIGNGKRPSYAIAGGIGIAMRTFSVTNSSIWFTGYFVRATSNNTNSASVATVPMAYGSGATAPIPVLTGSSVTNTHCGAKLFYADDSGAKTDQSASCTSSTALKADASSTVRGKGYSSDITLSGNTTLNAAPVTP